MSVKDTLLAVSHVAGGGSGGGGEAVLINSKDISANGTYKASDDSGDGYKKVVVSVSNSYAAGDEGKVVSSGALVSQSAHAEVTSNGTVDTTTNNSVTVNVPQPSGTKSISITANGTTTEDVSAYASASITANVANSYSAGDEGKVVSDGALVAQSSDTATGNGTVDTTLINSLTVAVDANDVARNILNKTITSYEDDGTTYLEQYAFHKCTNLTTFKCHNVTIIQTSSLAYTNISSVALPKLNHLSITTTSNAMNGCTSLVAVDLGGVFKIGTGMFSGDTALTTLILRSSSVIPLLGTNAFQNTPFKNGGTGGTIYIPKSLYDHLGDGTADDYKAATNWATQDGYGTVTWAKIEGSIYETQYADGTTIPTT